MNVQGRAGVIAGRLREEWHPLPAGTRLPSDRELAERHAVGRGVIAGAMRALEREGLIRRRGGAGTYWLGPGETLSSSVPSFSAWARAHGGKPSWRVVAQAPCRVAALERDYLRLPKNATVWKIQRVFTLDGLPTGFATSVLPVRDTPALPSELELYGSIFQTLCRRYRMGVVREWHRRRPAKAPASVLPFLGLAEPVPFDLEESVNRAADGTPAEYARTFLRLDAMERYARFRTPAVPSAVHGD